MIIIPSNGHINFNFHSKTNSSSLSFFPLCMAMTYVSCIRCSNNNEVNLDTNVALVLSLKYKKLIVLSHRTYMICCK